MAKVIFINGGSASGKTTLSKMIIEKLGSSATLISQDMFYRNDGDQKNTNFDMPEAFDWKLQRKVIKKLSQHEEAHIPIYDFVKSKRIGYSKLVPTDVIIFEGIFVFCDKELNEYSNFKIFVDTPSDIRLSRRILRDFNERKRTLEFIINQWNNDVEPSYQKFIKTNKIQADLIIPWTKIKSKSIRSLVTIIKHLKT